MGLINKILGTKTSYADLKQILINSQGRIKQIKLYESTAIDNVHPLFTIDTYEDALNYIIEKYSPKGQYCDGTYGVKKRGDEDLGRIIFYKRARRNSIPLRTFTVKFSMRI